MNDKEACSLLSLLEALVSGPFDEESIKRHEMYRELRDLLRAEGPEGLQHMLEQRLVLEKMFGAREDTDNAVVYRILFGDISETPLMMERFPRLCVWRLAQG